MNQTVRLLHRFGLRPDMILRIPLTLLAALAATACVYRIEIQQGNLLDDEDIVQIELGMTRSQVQFLLGTPMVADSFHRDRWDYAYYYRRGRSSDVAQRWLVVYFNEDKVTRVDRDLTLQPPS
jgi:outer membrane protein assembly factor BamE